MISSMSWCAVFVTPMSVFSWQQFVQCAEYVEIRPRSGLEDRNPGGGVWHEDREEAVAAFGTEFRCIGCDVHHGRLASRVHGDLQ